MFITCRLKFSEKDPSTDRGKQGFGLRQGHQQRGFQLPGHRRRQVRSLILETWQRHHPSDHFREQLLPVYNELCEVFISSKHDDKETCHVLIDASMLGSALKITSYGRKTSTPRLSHKWGIGTPFSVLV